MTKTINDIVNDALGTYGLSHNTECDECPGRENCRVGW